MKAARIYWGFMIVASALAVLFCAGIAVTEFGSGKYMHTAISVILVAWNSVSVWMAIGQLRKAIV